ncbi:hypothetical protein [Paraburkholderia hospita]|uniref:hypothetical protein n=1 Tax=Paraburkholderia hospita TaxID=169430 RepID=UPI003ECCA35A
MKTYARIDNGIVAEIIKPMADSEGNEIPIAERFTEEFVSTLVDVTDVAPQPSDWWTYDESTFNPPA